MEYQKIMNIEWDVTFDLEWLYTWLTRRWKAPNLQFSKNFFLGTIWGTTFGCKVTFVRFVDIFFIQKLKSIR